MSRTPGGTAVIEAPPEESLGPAMLACTDLQRRFVTAYLDVGGQNATNAALAAGVTPGNARQYASKLLHTPAIQAAMREEADKRLRGGAILGASVIIEIASDPSHKDRFKAADRLLASAGLNIETVNRHIIEDHRSDHELELMIYAMAKRAGLDPSTLLGKPTDVIDAEFEEVSFEGLEDVL